MTISRSFLYVSIIGFLVLASFAHAAVSEIDRPAPDITLYATPATATAGQSVTLAWTTRFATSCTATGGSHVGWS